MTALLAESIGQLRIAIAKSESRIDDLAFRSANEIIDRGDSLIVVDAAGCFEPARMTHSARTGAIDPALLLKKIRVLPARSAGELEDIIRANSNSPAIGSEPGTFWLPTHSAAFTIRPSQREMPHECWDG